MNAKKALSTLLLCAAMIAAAGLLPGQGARAADEKEKKTVSKDLAKPLKAAQDALQQKKYQDAISKLKEAESNPKKTPYDQHIINQLEGYAYARTNNYPEAAKAFEAELNDGYIDPNDVQSRVKALAQINYQLKNYDKAIEYGNRAIKGGFADEEMMTLVGQSYYLKGDWKGTQKFEDNLIDQKIKAGKTPKAEELQLALSSCVKLNDADCQTREFERMVTYDPKPEYWSNLLASLRNTQGLSDRNTLQVFRLMNEVDALKEPADYTEMAQLAIEQGSPGEAQQVLEKGLQKGIFADKRLEDKNRRLLESAKRAATTDQAGLSKAESEANSAPTGDKDVAVGLAYLGYKQYDKSADLINKGLTKGSVKSEPEARLLLGIAQLKGGHKDEAVKTFHAVKGDPNLERLANLWSLHAKQA
ncbi:MAG: tetratricopeptide repeat protein [Sinobacteraceae bacterium]|nr:tetratricopeptide repeat protein [Nevskiaceae bacterium]